MSQTTPNNSIANMAAVPMVKWIVVAFDVDESV